MEWIQGRIVAGHGVASGRADDCPFPGGSIRTQLPYFLARGIDLSTYYPGTLNVDLTPHIPHPMYPIFDGVLKWFGDLEEHFLLSRIVLEAHGHRVAGLWYYPDPATKVDHFQPASLVELLLPWTEGLRTGEIVRIGFVDEELE
jgi:hypothetical protein